MTDPVREAAEAALRGELIVIPTETVYGIGTRPDDPAATAKLFEVKGRPRELGLPVLVPSVAAARPIGEMDGPAEAMATRFWAGPLTIVIRRTEASHAWDLGGDPATIAVRMPHHPLALAVLARTGPLAVTSANRSGEPTPSTCEGLVAMLGEACAIYLCDESPLGGAASTVVDLAHGAARILRRGALAENEVLGALEET